MATETTRDLNGVGIRQLREHDLDEADRIFRVSFGTFIGLPQPEAFMAGAQLVRFRWRMDPESSLAAEVDGSLIGSNFVTAWGRFGFFGPLTVRPDYWDKGIAQILLDATMARFEELGIEHAGLFTFPDSAKHIWLYQKYGFWPRYLTAVMGKEVVAASGDADYLLLSTQPPSERGALLDAMLEVMQAVAEGLDVRREAEALLAQDSGDVVLLADGSRLQAFAICHFKPGSEAEPGTLFLKFAAVRPEAGDAWLRRLLAACENLAARQGKQRLVAGSSMERHVAYRTLIGTGFRTGLIGIRMQRPNDGGYDRADALVIDDLR